MPLNLTVDDYKEKSIVVRGDTARYQEQFAQLDGLVNLRLNGGPGWIFQKKHRQTIEDFIRTGNLPKTEKKETFSNNTSSSSSNVTVSGDWVSRTEFKKLEERIKKLEVFIASLEIENSSTPIHPLENENPDSPNPENGPSLLKSTNRKK